MPDDKWTGPGAHVQGTSANSVAFVVPKLFGRGEVGTFHVTCEQQKDGSIRVCSFIVQSLTLQSALLYVIPMGRKRVMALKPYRASVSQIRAALQVGR